jgi:hypothetical protein
MAVVFLEGGLSPYQCKWLAPNSIVGPDAGYVNLHGEHQSPNATRC